MEVDLRIVYAGVEPKEFQDIFPIWTEFGHVTESQLAEGRQQGQTSSGSQSFPVAIYHYAIYYALLYIIILFPF